MYAFHYDPTTGRYTGGTPVEFDQREPGRKLLPAWSTDVPPPPVHKGQTAYFLNGRWVVQSDPKEST